MIMEVDGTGHVLHAEDLMQLCLGLERYHEAYPILLASSDTIPNTDTDTEYDVISTTHQCHRFISTGQYYSHSHYHRRSDGRTV